MGSEIRVDFGALTRRSVHPAAPVLLTKNGPLSVKGSVAGFAPDGRRASTEDNARPAAGLSRCAASEDTAYQESLRSRPFIV